MPFSIRPYRRSPVHCAVTIHAGQSSPCHWPSQRSIDTVKIIYSIPPCVWREVRLGLSLSCQGVAREASAA
jgi:hypothetical protein